MKSFCLIFAIRELIALPEFPRTITKHYRAELVNYNILMNKTVIDKTKYLKNVVTQFSKHRPRYRTLRISENARFLFARNFLKMHSNAAKSTTKSML